MTLDETPVRNHRRALFANTPGGRRLRAAGTVALILATLAVGSTITSHTPDDDAMQQPFIRTGAIGSTVDARTLDVAVLGVRGAARITQDGNVHDTSGVWIIVKVRLTAHRDPTTLGYGALHDQQGRTYRASGRIEQFLLSARTLEPGLPITGELAFEVPVSVATSLSIRLGTSELDQRMDDLAQIRLPVTADQVRLWRTQKTPATVAAATVAGVGTASSGASG
jgi:hypothetical protein